MLCAASVDTGCSELQNKIHFMLQPIGKVQHLPLCVEQVSLSVTPMLYLYVPQYLPDYFRENQSVSCLAWLCRGGSKSLTDPGVHRDWFYECLVFRAMVFSLFKRHQHSESESRSGIGCQKPTATPEGDSDTDSAFPAASSGSQIKAPGSAGVILTGGPKKM